MKVTEPGFLKIGVSKLSGKSGRVILFSLLTAAVLAPLISNRLPWYLCLGDKHYFPILHPGGYAVHAGDTIWFRTVDFRSFDADRKVMPPIAYDSNTLDQIDNAGKSPFDKQYFLNSSGETRTMPLRYRHWLGTTRTGKDVLAVMIHGTSTAFLVGTISMLLAMAFGIGVGFFSGYFGNDRFHIRSYSLVWFLVSFPLFIFQLKTCVNHAAYPAGWAILVITPLALRWLLSISSKLLPPLRHRILLPIDDLVTSMTSGFTALPQLVLILSIMVITGPSLPGTIICIGLTSWPMIARAVRSESLRLRKEPFVESAQAIGSTPIRIALRHYLPNLSETLLVTFTAGFSGSVLLEAGMTFLGAGLPSDTASWGGLMAEARSDIRSWWLVVFPGLVLTLLTSALASRESRSR